MSEIERATSPFDAIRHEDERGEHWFARELMPMYGYGADWRNFANCIEAARIGARANDMDVTSLFVKFTEKTSGRPRQNYRVTRYAAYLIAMEGDAAKAEIAAAKHYFAVRTAQAEAAERAEAVPARPYSEIEMARRYVAVLEREATLKVENERLESFKGAIEAGDGLTLRGFHKKYFSELAEHVFMGHLYGNGYLINQLGKGSQRADGSFRDGSQHRHPTAKGKRFFYLHGHGVRGGRRRESTRVRPGDRELELKAVLIREGLPANNNDAGQPRLFAIEGDSA